MPLRDCGGWAFQAALSSLSACVDARVRWAHSEHARWSRERVLSTLFTTRRAQLATCDKVCTTFL
eukprot:6951853-Prymnesium_polylepis.1